jgi:DNA-binding NarL/FixJ family response regulator
MGVIVVDDSWLVRDGIVRLLNADGIEVLAQLGDASQLLSTARASAPEAVIIDVRMPPTFTTEGLQAALELKAELPEVGVLVLSQHVETRHTMDLLSAVHGGVGYLLKDRITRAHELVAAVRLVASGGTAIDPDVVRTVFDTPRRVDPLAALTSRERDVLELVSQGHANERIAAELGVSDRTIETHTSRIFSKLGLETDPGTHRRVLAVLAYLRSGNS